MSVPDLRVQHPRDLAASSVDGVAAPCRRTLSCTACSSTIIVPVLVSRTDFFFFFNDTATTEIYTLSLHDALPIFIRSPSRVGSAWAASSMIGMSPATSRSASRSRSEEHTSELQSPCNLVCRLLLEKKKTSPSYVRARSTRSTPTRSGREQCRRRRSSMSANVVVHSMLLHNYSARSGLAN